MPSPTVSPPLLTLPSEKVQSSSSSDASSTEADAAVPSIGHKRAHDGTTSATTAGEETSMDVTPVGDAGQAVSFGNDTKKPRSAPKGGNRTGKTDAERTLIHSYLRQGVDRYRAYFSQPKILLY